MGWKKQTVLAVVPARGGSKGIPGKNLRQVAGASLIAHAAATCSAASWIDRAVVSTDNANIADEAIVQGLDAPFRRPNDLSGDFAGSAEAWRHAWTECERIDDRRYDIGLLLEPTSPLRCPADIEQCLEALDDRNNSAAATVSRTPAHFTPHKTLTRDDAGHIGFYLSSGARHANRHTIPTHYHRNGLCYAVRRDTLLRDGHIIEARCAAIVTECPVVNIDEMFDLEVAEYLMRRQNGRLAA